MGIVTSLCSTIVNGQTTFGVKGGVNIANIKTKDMDNEAYKPRVSGHGGIYVNHMFNTHFAIQPEVLYSGEGQRFTLNNVEHRWSVNYIEIPLMLQVYPAKDFYIEAGPQVGLLLGAKDKMPNDNHVSIKGNFATAQFSVAAGVGFKVADRVTIYGRYNLGFTDIYSYDASIIQHSRVAQVGVAIRLKTL